MSTATIAAPDDGWLPGPTAARMAGLKSTRQLRKLARRGLVGVRAVPGAHPKYFAEDVARIASASIRPATCHPAETPH